MSNDSVSDHTAIFLMFLSLMVGMVVGAVCNHHSWKAEMVERGYAGYDRQTGEWQWKESGDE